MRDYGRVYSTFWPDMKTSSDDAKLLGAYLLTCSHGTIAGVCHLPDGYVSEDMGWLRERVAEGFSELSRKGFATRCPTTNWVWVTGFLDDIAYNPNQWKHARKIAASVPSQCSWRAAFQQKFAEAAGDVPKGSPTVPSVSGNGSGNGSGNVCVSESHTHDARVVKARTEALTYLARKGVTEAMVIGALAVGGVEDIGPDELDAIRGMVTAIKEEGVSVETAFAPKEAPAGKPHTATREPTHTRNPPQFRLTADRHRIAEGLRLDPEATLKEFNEQVKAGRLPNWSFRNYCETKVKGMHKAAQPRKHLNGSGPDVPE